MKVFKNRNKELETEIDAFLMLLEESASVFVLGVGAYLKKNPEDFQRQMKAIIRLEKGADQSLRTLVKTLYKYNLMPDLSADIFELMNALDEISDISKEVILDLDVEKFKVLDQYQTSFQNIADTSVHTVKNLINATRAFFANPTEIDHYIAAVRTNESEVDQIEYELKCLIFSSDDQTMTLCDKMHLRDLTEKIASLSDECEKIADQLAVLKFKRTI